MKKEEVSAKWKDLMGVAEAEDLGGPTPMDSDPEKDEVIEFQLGKAYRKANVPVQNLIHGVTKYFNGQTIITYVPSNSMFYEPPKRVMNVIASKSIKFRSNCILNIL